MFSVKIKWEFLYAVAMSVRLHGCTTWTLTKRFGKKVRWEPRKGAASYSVQIQEASPHKTATFRSLTPHLPKHPSETIET